MIRIGVCDDRREDIEKLQAYAAWFGEKHPEFPLKADAFTSPYDLLQAIHGAADMIYTFWISSCPA